MTQRTALIISTAFTVLMLLAALGLSVRVLRADIDSAIASNEPGSDTGDQDLPTYEYIQRLQESNDALAASFRRQLGLLDELEQVRAENAQLRERERQYQERLSEAILRLQRLEKQVGALPLPIEAPAAAQVSTTRGSDAQSRIAAAGAPAPGPRLAEQVRSEDRGLQSAAGTKNTDPDEDDDRPVRAEMRGQRHDDDRD